MYSKLLKSIGFAASLLWFVQVLPAQTSGKYIKQMEQDSFTLYFALPVSMKAENARMEFEPDFTYHAYEENPERDQVTMNFSLFTKDDPVKQIDHIELKAGEEVYRAGNAEFLYLEKNGRKWHSRFSAGVPLEGYRAVLEQAGNSAFQIHSPEGVFVFPDNKKWRKSAEIVAEYLGNQ